MQVNLDSKGKAAFVDDEVVLSRHPPPGFPPRPRPPTTHKLSPLAGLSGFEFRQRSYSFF